MNLFTDLCILVKDPCFHFFCLIQYLFECFKVERKAKIRNRYNQVPYLTWNTIWGSDKNTRKYYTQECQEVSLFICFVALRPKSTAMVMEGRSVHLITLWEGGGGGGGSLNKQLTSTSCTYICLLLTKKVR